MVVSMKLSHQIKMGKFKAGQRVAFTNPETGQIEYGVLTEKSIDKADTWYLKSDKKIIWWVKEYLLKFIN